eukprot:418952-Pyramimonas_sp.AAC.1
MQRSASLPAHVRHLASPGHRIHMARLRSVCGRAEARGRQCHPLPDTSTSHRPGTKWAQRFNNAWRWNRENTRFSN